VVFVVVGGLLVARVVLVNMGIYAFVFRRRLGAKQ
jgi:hypothetical protein